MHKLQKIKRNQLDVEKYSKALNDSLNYRIYAEYWYLDILTNEQWECWVYGDYEVVMPVPLKHKLGIKFVTQPIYCQQLGVFYKEEISNDLFRAFEKKLYRYFVRSYNFNEENTERYNPKGEKKVNYILELNRPYEEIFNGYTKNRRRDVKKAERFGLKTLETSDPENFIKIKFTNYPHLSIYVEEAFQRKFLTKLISNNKLIISDIFDESGNNIASQLFIKSGNRRIYMGFARDKEKENHNSSAYSIDYIIKRFSDSNLLIDFEGSMNPKIADFMEGFGVDKRYYTFFSNIDFKWKNFR